MPLERERRETECERAFRGACVRIVRHGYMRIVKNMKEIKREYYKKIKRSEYESSLANFTPLLLVHGLRFARIQQGEALHQHLFVGESAVAPKSEFLGGE